MRLGHGFTRDLTFSFTCRDCFFIGFISIAIFLEAGLKKRIIDGEVGSFFLCFFICIARAPAFLHRLPHFEHTYSNDIYAQNQYTIQISKIVYMRLIPVFMCITTIHTNTKSLKKTRKGKTFVLFK